ncbi:MAG TPA: serine/threonine-protein kinase [Candidatus Polarisedimenticolia bacterium]|nr:serine/threonine-protein kinase [Candidatus Polarisedimenticolia bacterium]
MARPLDPERWQQLERIFEAARGLQGDLRRKHLDEACAGDPDLRQRVADLLREDESGEESLADQVRGAVGSLLGTASRLGSADPGASSTEPGLGGTLIGPYRLEDVIGRGGMGTVWRAVRDDEAYKKEVAIKLMHRGLHDPGLRARFAAERQILATLDHSGIARLIDGGTSASGTPYVVMERIEGRPIDRYCDAGRLGIEARLVLFRQVCDAVSYAHRSLVVHRDLKPGNILVTAEGVPKLLDFGIAKLVDPSGQPGEAGETTTGLRLLTPEYASPEQVRGGTITTSCDVYALGVILYELLTGRHPYRRTGGDRLELERAICEQEPERPSTAVSRDPQDDRTTAPNPVSADDISRARDSATSLLRKRLHGDLDNIVLKALRKEPADRYASVDLLSEDIRRHLNGMPVAARPATLRYRTGKFVSRHRRGIGAATAGVILVVSLAVFYAARLSEARRRAEAEARSSARVSDFLVDLFRSADPMEARGEAISARQLLDRGARRIQSGLSEDPAIQERLLRTMARAYLNLSALDPSLDLTDAALALEERTDGEGPAERAALLRLRGTILTGMARYDEARTILQTALQAAREAYGPRHEEVVYLGNELAQVDEMEGHYPAAEKAYLESLHVSDSLPGAPDTLAAADTHNRLGSLYIALGRHDEAIQRLKECVRVRQHLLEENAVEKAVCLSRLGEAYREKGDYVSAEPLLVEDLRLSREILGGDSRTTADSLLRLASLYKQRGEPGRALPLVEEALSIDTRVLGEAHPRLADVLNDLANVLEDLGRTEESVTVQRKALSTATAALGPDHPAVATNLNNLASKLKALGRYEEAETMYRRTLELDRRTLGEKHPYVAMDLCNLAVLYMSMRRHAEAERLLREALAMQDGNPDVNPDNLATTLTSLGNLLVITGRAALGEPFLRRAVQERAAVAAPDSVSLATSRSLLGRALLNQGRLEETRSLMEASYDVLKAKLPAGHITLRRATERMVDLYEALGDTEKAAAMRDLLAQGPGQGWE